MDTITSLATDERSARAALSAMAEPDDLMTGRVLASVGAVELLRVLDSDGPTPALDKIEAALWRKQLMPKIDIAAMRQAVSASREGEFGLLIPGDRSFAESLSDLGDRAPYVLWVKGTDSLLAGTAAERFTITGARAATGYGMQVAGELASDLARDKRVLVAGGAYGIDGAVHRAALAVAGHTVAVLAGGVDRLYPTGHRELLERVGEVGLLVSELPPGAAPTRGRFLARARIEAALSGSTTIVEAGYRSGSLRVAEQARDLGRAVGAVPGPVTSAASAGPHRLLRDGIARIVTDAQELRSLMETDPSRSHGLRLGPNGVSGRRSVDVGQVRFGGREL